MEKVKRRNKPVRLRGFGPDDFESLARNFGQPAYRGRQLFRWIYGRNTIEYDKMGNLPASFRKMLQERSEINCLKLETLQVARDGTVKVLFELPSGRKIESVLIPDFDSAGKAKRLTVCVSSQVGCAMACSFCATGQMGFRENLLAGEIAEQVYVMNTEAIRRFGKKITNVVYMGMGEPMLNYDAVIKSIKIICHPLGLGMSPRRITVSTVGLARRIKALADEALGVKLAVSLHAPTDERRSSIMPVNRNTRTDLAALKEAVQYYVSLTGSKVTYEYCMFAGFNDREEDARALAKVVRWASSKVNLIMYNPVKGLGFQRSSEDQLERFIKILVSRGVIVTVRRSRGQEIDAACGQLAVKSGAVSPKKNKIAP